MTSTDFIEFIPSALSAVASIFAAVAAFGSLKVGRQSKRIAEQGALAMHHGPASIALTDALEAVAWQSEAFSELAMDVLAYWARKIEQYDCPSEGGSDPRPLRHVLTNVSEMLERHATNNRKDFRHVRVSMSSILHSGMGSTAEIEYRRLLKKADGTYGDFESVLGTPRVDKKISSAAAFRWAYYQLARRVPIDDWSEIWAEAWNSKGWLRQYRDQFELIEPVLKSNLERLKAEKGRLQHTAFPLDTNASLNFKYNRTIGILESLLEVGGLNLSEGYISAPHRDDLVLLVMYSMGVVLLGSSSIEELTYGLTD